MTHESYKIEDNEPLTLTIMTGVCVLGGGTTMLYTLTSPKSANKTLRDRMKWAQASEQRKTPLAYELGANPINPYLSYSS